MKYQTAKGTVVNLRNDQINTVLEEAGFIKPYVEPPPSPNVTKWTVGMYEGCPGVIADCKCGAHTKFLNPNESSLFFHVCHGHAEPIPAEKLSEVRALKAKSLR